MKAYSQDLWREQTQEPDARTFVFLDESGSNIALTRLYARAPKGKRARGSLPRNLGKNMTLISSLSLQGVGESLLRRIGARTCKALQEALEYALTTVSASDASGWFSHCGYFPAATVEL